DTIGRSDEELINDYKKIVESLEDSRTKRHYVLPKGYVAPLDFTAPLDRQHQPVLERAFVAATELLTQAGLHEADEPVELAVPALRDDDDLSADHRCRMLHAVGLSSSARVIDDVATSLDIDDTCRTLKFEVPESGGSDARITLSLWQVDDGSGEPYVYCEMPASVYSKEDDAISFACVDDYYCQEAGEAFLTSDCYDACDDPGIGGVDNRTVVTTVDEYCAECPPGSACDNHGTSLHTVKPYAPTGYYGLDLGGADSDVACVEHREHRPHYCYDFSWCIRQSSASAYAAHDMPHDYQVNLRP
ncbi:hypothetical protein AURANDRAFT_68711, partial [Aureococcus anophagefferens]